MKVFYDGVTSLGTFRALEPFLALFWLWRFLGRIALFRLLVLIFLFFRGKNFSNFKGISGRRFSIFLSLVRLNTMSDEKMALKCLVAKFGTRAAYLSGSCCSFRIINYPCDRFFFSIFFLRIDNTLFYISTKFGIDTTLIAIFYFIAKL